MLSGKDILHSKYLIFDDASSCSSITMIAFDGFDLNGALIAAVYGKK